MKIRWIASAMVLSLVTVCPDLAHAGAGGPGASVPVTLFDCYVLQNAADTGFVLEVNDQFGTEKHVRLGKATLVCTRTLTTGGAVVEQGGNFNPDAATHPPNQHLKCYDVPDSSGPVGETVKVIDIFGTDTTEVMRLSYVCAPAFKEVVQ